MATLLSSTCLTVASAQAQNIANPPVPFVNNVTINSVRFNDGAAHNAGGVPTVTNNGQINPVGNAVLTGSGIIVVDGSSLLGSIVNSLTGSINAPNVFNGTGIGIGMRRAGTSTVTGDLINNGSISVGSEGIGLTNAVLSAGSGGTGSIINNGSITVPVASSAQNGIHLFGSTVAGAILNTGTITTADGQGISVDNNTNFSFGGVAGAGASSVAGGIRNTGTITLLAGASGFGGIIEVSGSPVTGGITNDGTLTSNAGGSGIFVNTFGLFAPQTFTGDIVNNGTLTISGTSSSPDFSPNIGIQVEGSSGTSPLSLVAGGGGTGAIINNGTLTATTGISVGLAFSGGGFGGEVTVSGGIINTGTINSTTAIDLSPIGVRPAITVNQNAGAINGAVRLSPTIADIFNINGGAMNGAVTGGTASRLNVTGGTLVGDVTGVGLFTVNRADAFTYGSVFSGSGAFQKNGTGTTTFTGANTYTGGTTISAGTLQLGNGGTSGSIAGNVLDNSVFAVNRSDSVTLDGVISGTGAFQQNGIGTTIFTGANTYSGGTTINAGTLQLGNGGTSGSIAGNVLDNGIFAVNRSDVFTFGGLISGTGAFQQNGAGTTTLTGANTYSGGTAINAGVLAVASNANLGAAAGGLSFNGGTLRYLASFDMARATTLNAGGGTFDTNGFSSTLSGAIAGSGGLTKAGAGTLAVSGAGTYTGGTTISGGTLQIGNGGTTGSIAGNVTNNANLAFNRSDGVTFGGTISGTGAVQQLAGSTTFTANNTYTGGTTIAAGSAVVLGNGGTTGAITGNVANSGLLGVNRSNNLTLDGVISGTGAFQQFGSGTTIFTGANTYTGGTQIGLGTLQLGNGGTTGSIAGNVINNANLAFNRSDAVTFGGVISGTGAVAHNGTGNTTFTAANTYTGLTNINAGIVTVDGSLASKVNVNSGGTLMGTGTVGGVTAASGGTVAPGHSIGTVNVAGNVAFAAGSTYQVEANAGGQSDLIAATGTATLSGGTVQLIASGINGCGQSYSFTILTAAGGVGGTFGGATSNANLSPTLSYNANSVSLNLKGGALPSFSPTARTANQRGVTGALDVSPCTSALVQAFLPLTAPQALQAFDQVSGELHASTAGVLVDESRYMRGAVLGRLRQASYGGDSSMASLSLGGPQVVGLQDEELNSVLAYGKMPVKTMPLNRGPDVAFWAQGFGAWGKFDADGNAAALKRDLTGFITGFDVRFGGTWRAGVAVGYTASRNTTDGRGSSNVETGHVAAYGGTSIGALNLRAGGAYAFHTIDTDRNIVFPGFFDRATAHYQGGTGQIFGEAGYGVAFGKLAVEPFAGGAWVHLSTDAFSEGGGIAALNGAASSFEVGYSSLGIRAASIVPLDNGMVLVPRASAAWQHAFNSVTPTSALAFQSTGASFIVVGVPIARDSLLTEAGLDLAINRHATLGVSYVGQIASNVTDHAAKGKFSWKF